MKTKSGCRWIPWLLAVLSLIFLRSASALAANDSSEMSLTLNAGESYVIDKVAKGDAPSVRVIDNPHALILHNEEPGKVVLLGAEKGRWAVKVKMDSGDSVTYDVVVKSEANNLKINDPGVAPPTITGSGKKEAIAAAPVVAKLDEGAGPVSSGSISGAATPADATKSETVAGGAMPAPPPPGAPAPSAAPDEPAASSPTIPSQAPVPTVREAMAPAGSGAYQTDPSLIESGRHYSTESVSGGTHYLPEDVVLLMAGSSRIIDFPSKIKRISIADTGIADIQVVNPYQLNLIGHKAGFTTLAVWNTQGHYEERQVRVDASGKQQVLLNTMVAELDKGNLENQGANLAYALPRLGLSFVGLPGAVATPFSPQTSASGGGSVNNTLPPGGTLLGMLLSQNLTYGVAAGNNNYQVQTLFQYLENHQLAKILAQPRLLANSGEQAKFLSGGEIPIVIAQALNTSIVFKQFGTSVEFVPTVVGRNQIELLVKPEVSEPDPANGVQMFGFSIPAFVTRRAETMVRLRDSQTLIIAGLIQHRKKTQVQKVPYLGDIPYLSGLFKNTSYTMTETDLVMSVTPQIVAPLPDGSAPYNAYDTPEMTRQGVETRRLAEPDVTRPRF